jgi:flagellar protein FlbD
VVTLTHLTGSVFALNSDLIERVDGTPDTVITLVDGTRYVVREPLDEVVDRVRRFRGSVIAAASNLQPPADQDDLPAGSRRLGALPEEREATVVPFPLSEA